MMTTTQASPALERAEIRELGDELISAAREVIRAYQDIGISASDWRTCRRFERAIDRLVELVGKP
jgi:hypothetical protein